MGGNSRLATRKPHCQFCNKDGHNTCDCPARPKAEETQKKHPEGVGKTSRSTKNVFANAFAGIRNQPNPSVGVAAASRNPAPAGSGKNERLLPADKEPLILKKAPARLEEAPPKTSLVLKRGPQHGQHQQHAPVPSVDNNFGKKPAPPKNEQEPLRAGRKGPDGSHATFQTVPQDEDNPSGLFSYGNAPSGSNADESSPAPSPEQSEQSEKDNSSPGVGGAAAAPPAPAPVATGPARSFRSTNQGIQNYLTKQPKYGQGPGPSSGMRAALVFELDNYKGGGGGGGQGSGSRGAGGGGAIARGPQLPGARGGEPRPPRGAGDQRDHGTSAMRMDRHDVRGNQQNHGGRWSDDDDFHRGGHDHHVRPGSRGGQNKDPPQRSSGFRSAGLDFEPARPLEPEKLELKRAPNFDKRIQLVKKSEVDRRNATILNKKSEVVDPRPISLVKGPRGRADVVRTGATADHEKNRSRLVEREVKGKSGGLPVNVVSVAEHQREVRGRGPVNAGSGQVLVRAAGSGQQHAPIELRRGPGIVCGRPKNGPGAGRESSADSSGAESSDDVPAIAAPVRKASNGGERATRDKDVRGGSNKAAGPLLPSRKRGDRDQRLKAPGMPVPSSAAAPDQPLRRKGENVAARVPSKSKSSKSPFDVVELQPSSKQDQEDQNSSSSPAQSSEEEGAPMVVHNNLLHAGQHALQLPNGGAPAFLQIAGPPSYLQQQTTVNAQTGGPVTITPEQLAAAQQQGYVVIRAPAGPGPGAAPAPGVKRTSRKSNKDQNGGRGGGRGGSYNADSDDDHDELLRRRGRTNVSSAHAKKRGAGAGDRAGDAAPSKKQKNGGAGKNEKKRGPGRKRGRVEKRGPRRRNESESDSSSDDSSSSESGDSSDSSSAESPARGKARPPQKKRARR